MTLEEAQAEILRLKEEVSTLRTENGNYATQVETLTAESNSVRELNQKYFLKLTAQYDTPGRDEEDEPEKKSCEDFAKDLTI